MNERGSGIPSIVSQQPLFRAGGRVAQSLSSLAAHDVVHLLQLVGESLLAAKFVLVERENELLVVLHRVPEVRLR